jgi:hypothetical protein
MLDDIYIYIYMGIWGIYLHNPTDISENCVVQQLKVSYDKNRIDPICEELCRMTQSVGLCK